MFKNFLHTALYKILFAIIFTVCLNSTLFSEEFGSPLTSQSKGADWALTIYPYVTVLGVLVLSQEGDTLPLMFSAELEYKLNDYFSLPVDVHYLFFSDGEYMVNLAAVGPGLRIYLQGNGMKGFFVGHYLQFLFGNIHGWDDDVETINESLYFGMPRNYISTTWLGYRWMFSDFHFEFSAGAFSYYSLDGRNRDLGFLIIPAGFGLGFGKTF